MPVPKNNPLTAESVELGRRLFFEKRLSRDGTLACASCHLRERSFTDGRPVAVGIGGKRGHRNVPTLLNRAYGRSMFWDGRAASLEEQALQPMVNPRELGNTREEIVRRLQASETYRRLFRRAFRTEQVTIERVTRAIASFERTLLSANSPFDRYELLHDKNALSESARRGLDLFRGKANCSVCHSGPLFSDERFHNTGVSWGRQPLDLGRYEVTKLEGDKGKFKTPTLREVEKTAPYMHDGSLKTLQEVVESYNRGGGPNSYLDSRVRPLNLTPQEKSDLVAFLKSLSGSLK
ncbi:c-type cytochrome [Acidobacteria bacterium AH-259-G07]|nr:c-type cytochrome [Acidobacteria bacterium AH-259-G07]